MFLNLRMKDCIINMDDVRLVFYPELVNLDDMIYYELKIYFKSNQLISMSLKYDKYTDAVEDFTQMTHAIQQINKS